MLFQGIYLKIKKFKLNDGTYFRYKKIGRGKPILLLHTFRNRLEYSDKLGDLLKKKYTVYSIDLPGFGSSPINPKTVYDLDFFTDSITNFIQALKINNLTIAGESIGAVLSASISSRIPKQIKKILCLIHMIMTHILVKAFKGAIFLQNLFYFILVCQLSDNYSRVLKINLYSKM